MADKTKAEFLQELKDANTKIFDNVNGARIEITGSEFDTRLDDKAQGLYDQQEYNKIVTNGGQHDDYLNMRFNAVSSNSKINNFVNFLDNFMSAIQAGKFGTDAQSWDAYTEWKAIQDKYTQP
mgnify:CR=1 FL=1|tara:strand:- start:40 stop:408 length:369 start_codon:yes stop_codon:yes gene_type:complete